MRENGYSSRSIALGMLFTSRHIDIRIKIMKLLYCSDDLHEVITNVIDYLTRRAMKGYKKATI